MESVFKQRIALLNKEIEKRHLDSMLVTSRVNVTYLSGFLGDDSAILATKKKKYFITDSRYIEEVKRSIKGFELRLVRKSTYESLVRLINDERLKRIGFESMNLPYAVAATAALNNGRTVSFFPVTQCLATETMSGLAVPRIAVCCKQVKPIRTVRWFRCPVICRVNTSFLW